MTNTAAALAALTQTAQAASALKGFDPLTWLHLLVGGIAVLLSPVLMQDVSEIIITVFDVPMILKPFVPRVLSGIVGYMTHWAGLDPATASEVAGYLMVGAEWVNRQTWSLELESKIQGIFTKGAAAAPKAAMVLLLIGLGLLTGSARAAFNLGTISPTAGALTWSVQPAVDAAVFKINPGLTAAAAPDAIVGLDLLANWGAYELGVQGAFDRDVTDQVNYLAGGIVAGIQPYGTANLLWRSNAALLVFSVPIGAGVQATQ